MRISISFKVLTLSSISNYYKGITLSSGAINSIINNNIGTDFINIRGGTISKDLTWDNIQPWIVTTSHVTIDKNATLTLGTNTIVKSTSNPIYVEENSSLNAPNGAIFTSIKDDIGGDTNGDGSESNPETGNWNGIHFKANSKGLLNK